MTAAAADADAVAAADPCPECGYDRRGSAAGGACPECGYRQPADEFVFWGRSKSHAGAASWEEVAVQVGILLALYAGLVLVLYRLGLMLLQGCVNLVFLGGGVALLKWWRSRPDRATGRGRQQLRLSPRGYAVRTGPGRVAWNAWTRRCRAHTRFVSAGEVEVVIEKPLLGFVKLVEPLVFRPARDEASAVSSCIVALAPDVFRTEYVCRSARSKTPLYDVPDN